MFKEEKAVQEEAGVLQKGVGEAGKEAKRIPHRTKPRIDDGNAKEGWQHINERHVTGNAPKDAGDLFAPGTTREQIERAAQVAVEKGKRISDPSRRIQTFEKKMIVNKQKETVRVIVDSDDANRVITIFPVRGGK